MIYLNLFFVFFRIGLFSFGGGLAMLPLMELELTGREWIRANEFYNMVAVAQVTPGAISVNMATFVGQKVAGILGSISATVGLCLPSFILMFLLYGFLVRYKEHPLKLGLFRGVKAASIALIFYASYSIGDTIFHYNNEFHFPVIFISIIAYVLLQNKKIHPMMILAISGILGYFIL